jgi:hypothetical protein
MQKLVSPSAGGLRNFDRPGRDPRSKCGGIPVSGGGTGALYRTVPDITYLRANNYDLKLDMYQARGQNSPKATVI